MARTLSTAETKVYAAGHMTVPLQVWIKDGTGTWVELTDLEGHNFVRAVEIGADIDEPVESATIDLEPSVYDFKLSPLYQASKINNPSGGLEERIAIGREVAILAAVLPKDAAEPSAASGWRLIFSGDVVAVDIAGMSLRCVDKGGRLQRRKLERAGQPEASPGGGGVVQGGDPYIAVGATVAAETLMQSILTDWADPAVTLVTPVSPAWVLTETWSQSNPPEGANILDVLRSIASMIGWDVRYRFDATATDPFGVTAGAGGVGNYTLQFYEPDRSNTTPDITLGADDYHAVGSIVEDVATVANRVEVFYNDDPDPAVRRLRSVIAENAASKTAYGTLYLRVAAEDIPGITTEALADTLAAAILSDVVDPRAEMTAEAVFLYHVELFDLIRFSANGEHFDGNQDLAVAGWRHRFSDGDVTTSLTLSGTIKGHRGNYWLAGLGVDQTVNGYDNNDIANGGDHTVGPGNTGTQPQPPDLTSSTTLNGFRLKVADLPLDYSHVEWHIDTTASTFTPSASTLAAITDGSAYIANNLVQGTTHYAKAVVVAKTGIRSTASAAITALPGQTIAKLEVESEFFASKAWADGMPFATTISRAGTNYCKNPSFETDTSFWEEYSSDASATAPTLSRVTTAGNFVFGAAALKVANADTTWTGFIGAAITKASAPAASSGDVWSASAWVKASTSIGVTIDISFYDVSDALTGSTGYSLDVGTGWLPISVTSDAAPANTTYAILRIFSYTANTAFDLYIDGVVLEDASSPSEFFDGSMGQGYAWSGTAHLSTSTREGGLHNHGALATGADPFVAYEDGEISHGQFTPSVGSAAKIGLPGHALRIAGAGTAFPPTPSTNDRYTRTDRGIDYYYDGTRWLSVTEYSTDMSTYGQLWSAVSTSGTTVAISRVPDLGGTQIYLTKWRIRTQVGGTNNGTDYWTLALQNDAGSTISSFNTSADGASGADHDATINSVRTNSTDKYWFVLPTKTLTPGNMSVLGCSLQFRLIG